MARRPKGVHMLTGTRSRRWLLVAGLLLTVALAGCADATPTAEVRAGPSTVATSRPPAVGPSTTTPSSDPDGSESGDPGVVDPSPPAPGDGDEPTPGGDQPAKGDRHPQQWDGYTVGADGRTLTFIYYAGVAPCSVFDSIEAVEGPDTVRVTIFEHSGPPGVVCIMLAQQKSASVTLTAPLGDRRVVAG